MTKKKRIIAIILIIALLCFAVTYYGMYFNGLSGMHSNISYTDGQIKIACIGDSTTYGHGIKNWKSNNYPAVLQRELDDGYCVVNFGFNGACTQSFAEQPYTENEIFKESLGFDADIIIFMLGTNDSSEINFRSAGDFKKEYSELIEKYLDGENSPEIILCTPPSAFYIDGKTEGPAEFNVDIENLAKISDAVRELANEREFTLIDINSFTESHSEWFLDGVHPNNKGAKEIAKEISENIE